MEVDVTIGDYPKEAEKLVEVWKRHIEINGELGVITFKNKRPKRPKGNKRKIAGLEAESIMYLNNGEELIKMSVENYIYLMAKCGVDVQITERAVKG